MISAAATGAVASAPAEMRRPLQAPILAVRLRMALSARFDGVAPQALVGAQGKDANVD